MEDEKKPSLCAVDKVVKLEQPLSTAEAALNEFNDPENIENTQAQAAIDASIARIRFVAFCGQGFDEDQALELVIRGDGGGYRD